MRCAPQVCIVVVRVDIFVLFIFSPLLAHIFHETFAHSSSHEPHAFVKFEKLMDTKDLFPTSDPPSRMYSSYGTKPYTPRLPASVQGSRSHRMKPLPLSVRSVATSAGSAFNMTSATQQQMGMLLTNPSDFAVVPYQSAVDSLDVLPSLGLDDDDDPKLLMHVTESSRIRYAMFVHEMAQQETAFHSPSLFANAIIREMECRRDATASMKVAAATWALELITAQPGFEFLLGVRNLLLPALYVKYDASQLSKVSAAARSVLQNTPGYVVHQNPFLSHDIYAEDFMLRMAERQQAEKIQAKLDKIGMSRKNAVQNMTAQLCDLRKGLSFRAWRALVRRKAFERVSRANRIRRNDESTRSFLLQSSFSVWKSSVERTRSVFLSERLHNAAAQLENAKNQFQLQCFRSDKHLFTVEELREELARLRKEYDETVAQKRDVERRLRDHDNDTQKQLNQNANTVLRELGLWRRFARRCVEGLSAHDETVKALEEQQRGMLDLLSNSDDDVADLVSTTASSKRSAAQKASLNVSQSSALNISTSEGAAGSTTQQPGPRLPDMSNNSEAILIAWVRSALQAAPVTPSISHVTNFTTDFQNGEVMLLVLHHVFPADVPLTPLQEANIAKRLEKLIQSFVRCGVAVVPRVSDFVDCNSDIIYVALAELFGRSLQLQSLRKSKELMEGSYTGLDDPIAAQIEYTQDMLPSMLEHAQEEREALIEQEKTHRRQGGTLLKWQETVSRDAAFATRERMSGNPVRAIGKSNVEKYWKFKMSRFADLEQKYKVKEDGWKEHLTGSVRKALQKYVHTTSRMFFHYAHSATVMNEVHFWRLAVEMKMAEKPLGSAVVEKIFSQVAKSAGNNPDLADGPENVLLQEISPADFIEILVRVADAKYTSKSLPEKVEQLLQNCTKIRSDPSPLESLVTDAAVKVLERYLVDLCRVFLFYSKRMARPQGVSNRLLSALLHVDHLQQMFDDIGAIRTDNNVDDRTGAAFLTTQELKATVRSVVPEQVVDLPTGGGASQQPPLLLPPSELYFHQFLQVVECLCIYRNPDPYVPFDKKVEMFVSYLIAKVRAKHRGSSLVVSDVRIVTQ